MATRRVQLHLADLSLTSLSPEGMSITIQNGIFAPQHYSLASGRRLVADGVALSLNGSGCELEVTADGAFSLRLKLRPSPVGLSMSET